MEAHSRSLSVGPSKSTQFIWIRDIVLESIDCVDSDALHHDRMSIWAGLVLVPACAIGGVRLVVVRVQASVIALMVV